MRVVRSGNFWIGVAVGAVVVPWAMQKFTAKKMPAASS